MDLIGGSPPEDEESRLEQFFKPIFIKYQSAIDKLNPYTKARWFVTLTVFLLYVIRIYCVQGFHIVTYTLAIYLLSLFIHAISPRVDPELADLLDEAPTLPRTEDDEYRPFIPRLLEFKFWHNATRGIMICLLCTFIPFLDIPVFWPILVIYFILLFTAMMKRQIKHMIRHRYVPFSYGKPHPSGKVIVS